MASSNAEWRFWSKQNPAAARAKQTTKPTLPIFLDSNPTAIKTQDAASEDKRYTLLSNGPESAVDVECEKGRSALNQPSLVPRGLPKGTNIAEPADTTMGSGSLKRLAKYKDTPIPRTTSRPVIPNTTHTPNPSPALPAHFHQHYQQPRTTLKIIRFWEQYFSSVLPTAFDFVFKQWHSDPPYNIANRRYVVDIGVNGTSQLLLTGLIARPHDLRARSVHEFVRPIPVAQRGLLLPGGEIVFFVADQDLVFYVYNLKRNDVRTLIRFENPIAECSAVTQELKGYLEELKWHSDQQRV